ncbi:hypothetical protein [Sneathiella glossodoripedis]
MGQLSHDDLVLKKGKNLYLKNRAGIEELINSLASSTSNVAR